MIASHHSRSNCRDRRYPGHILVLDLDDPHARATHDRWRHVKPHGVAHGATFPAQTGPGTDESTEPRQPPSGSARGVELGQAAHDEEEEDVGQSADPELAAGEALSEVEVDREVG